MNPTKGPPTNSSEKSVRQNRVREALGKIYDQEPPYFREYLRRFKEDPTSRVFAPLAEAYRRLGRVDEAIELCREGLGHHPEFHGGRVSLAKCLIDKKLYAEAKGELDRVVAASPENLLAQRLLGDACTHLRDRRGALHCYKMALLLSPNDVALAEKVHSLEMSAEQEDAGVVNISDEVDELPPSDEDALDDVLVAESAEADFQPPRDSKEEDFWSPEADLVAEAAGAPSREATEPISLETAAAEPEPPPASTGGRADLDSLLGADEDGQDDSFKIEHVSAIFSEENEDKTREITTATLGDLYYSQGQFDRAIRIFEKIASQRPTPELSRKINACRVKLGVDHEALIRNRQIETLRTILRKVRAGR